MHPKLIITTALTVGLLVPAVVLGNQGETMSEEQTAVLSTVKHMTSSLEGGKLDDVMSTYAKDATVVFEPGADPVTDRETIRQIFAEMAAANPQVTYAGHEVYVAGDVAVHLAPWAMKGKAPDGTKLEQGGLSIAVLRRQADGAWKLAIDNPYGARLLQK